MDRMLPIVKKVYIILYIIVHCSVVMYNKEHNNNYYELLPQSWYKIVEKRKILGVYTPIYVRS